MCLFIVVFLCPGAYLPLCTFQYLQLLYALFNRLQFMLMKPQLNMNKQWKALAPGGQIPAFSTQTLLTLLVSNIFVSPAVLQLLTSSNSSGLSTFLFLGHTEAEASSYTLTSAQ